LRLRKMPRNFKFPWRFLMLQRHCITETGEMLPDLL